MHVFLDLKNLPIEADTLLFIDSGEIIYKERGEIKWYF